MAVYSVEIREADGASRQVRVTDRVEIGRQCDGVVVSDPQVSRRHVALCVTPDGLTVSDLGSTNGTRVNGTRITGETPLRPGDHVALGGVEVLVQVTDDVGGPVAPPPISGNLVAALVLCATS